LSRFRGTFHSFDPVGFAIFAIPQAQVALRFQVCNPLPGKLACAIRAKMAQQGKRPRGYLGSNRTQVFSAAPKHQSRCLRNQVQPCSNLPPFLPLFYGSASKSRFKIGGNAMVKAVAVCALCIVSAVVGAGIDHYFAVAIEQGAPHLQQAVSSNAAVAAPAEMNVEVLGDRVRCDVRYQELKIPPDEYQSFKRKCMGDKYSDND
jgi:hypothetical protein